MINIEDAVKTIIANKLAFEKSEIKSDSSPL
jgi:hypothetical protein